MHCVVNWGSYRGCRGSRIHLTPHGVEFISHPIPPPRIPCRPKNSRRRAATPPHLFCTVVPPLHPSSSQKTYPAHPQTLRSQTPHSQSPPRRADLRSPPIGTRTLVRIRRMRCLQAARNPTSKNTQRKPTPESHFNIQTIDPTTLCPLCCLCLNFRRSIHSDAGQLLRALTITCLRGGLAFLWPLDIWLLISSMWLNSSNWFVDSQLLK